MGEIEWAMWANEQAIISAFVTMIGGIIGVASGFKNWQFAAFAIPASVLILLMEYPRSCRKKGHTVERKFQQILTPVVDKLGIFGRNYFVRFVLHIIFSVPCCFLLPTMLGGMCLQLSGIIYLVAAVKGEEWKPVKKLEEDNSSGPKVVSSEPPAKPPPRAPVRKQAAENVL